MSKKPKHGDLQVWWVPQVPMKSFRVDVATVVEGKLLLDALAQYDLFQFHNNVKPDYSNAGGLQIFDANDHGDGPEGSWVDWYCEDGEDIEYYDLEDLRHRIPQTELTAR